MQFRMCRPEQPGHRMNHQRRRSLQQQGGERLFHIQLVRRLARRPATPVEGVHQGGARERHKP
jgi:hypothetical protein